MSLVDFQWFMTGFAGSRSLPEALLRMMASERDVQEKTRESLDIAQCFDGEEGLCACACVRERESVCVCVCVCLLASWTLEIAFCSRKSVDFPPWGF